MSSSTPMAAATALALRDAGAKLAVEFREQAIVRGLLPESAQDTTPAGAPTAAAPLPESNPGPSVEKKPEDQPPPVPKA
jgi:hypothetical protein